MRGVRLLGYGFHRSFRFFLREPIHSGSHRLRVQAIASPTNNHKVVMRLFKSIIFPSFKGAKIVISNGGSHFVKIELNKLLKKYKFVNKVGAPNHP